jgi:hypothetical protein
MGEGASRQSYPIESIFGLFTCRMEGLSRRFTRHTRHGVFAESRLLLWLEVATVRLDNQAPYSAYRGDV